MQKIVNFFFLLISTTTIQKWYYLDPVPIQTWNDIEKLFPYFFFFQWFELNEWCLKGETGAVWFDMRFLYMKNDLVFSYFKSFVLLRKFYFGENRLTIAHLRTNVKLKSCKNVFRCSKVTLVFSSHSNAFEK